MVTGIVYFEVHIPHAHSIKEKRSVLSSLKQKIRNKFNVSIAEVDHLDKWQRGGLGISIVTTDQSQLDAILSKLESFIAQEYRLTVTLWDVRLA